MTVSDSWRSGATPGLKAGAAIAVVAAHAVVAAALMLASPEDVQLEEPVAVQVRFVEIAPEVQELQAAPGEPSAPQPVEASADPEPELSEPQPEPPPEPPQPEPQPSPPEPPPEPEPEPPPPEPEPEPPPPEPEPEPPPPEPEPPKPVPPPEPKPKPKPEPKPKPKPEPKPESKIKPRPEPKPLPAPPAARLEPQAPTGNPDADARRQAAPDRPVAPPSDKPRMIGSVDYVGQRPVPNYPRTSQRMREEGRVVVRVMIDGQGRVQRASVQRSSGFDRLDEEALKAARRARFKPYTENGVPYPAMADLPFDFKLR